MTFATQKRRVQWSAQPARYRRRLREMRRLYEGRRLKTVTATLVVLAVVSGTTAFTRDADAPAVDPRALTPAAMTPTGAVRDSLEAIEVTGLAGTSSQQKPPRTTVEPALAPVIDRFQPGRPQAWQRYAVAVAPADGRPMIAIVIDDVGVNRRQAQEAIKLPGPLTMALMSYARGLPRLAEQAHQAGHELLLHLPMEPSDSAADPGPNALLAKHDAPELERRLDWALSRFDGFVGVNNHMGSLLTEDPQAMSVVMRALRKRGLLFLDSRTSPGSLGYETAVKQALPAATRDVFLDHNLGPPAIRDALAQLEKIAQKRGYAIGIAHPHGTTVQVLREWLSTVEDRGFQLVPISAAIARNRGLG